MPVIVPPKAVPIRSAGSPTERDEKAFTRKSPGWSAAGSPAVGSAWAGPTSLNLRRAYTQGYIGNAPSVSIRVHPWLNSGLDGSARLMRLVRLLVAILGWLSCLLF